MQRFRTHDGIDLAYEEAGDPDGPPVILLHGGGQTRHSWHGTATTLADRGWRAVSLDMRGHGESHWDPEGDYSLDAFAGDIALVAETFDRRPALVGASLWATTWLLTQSLAAMPFDAKLTDLVLKPDFGYWVSLSRDFRERAIAAGYRDAMAREREVRAVHRA